MKIFLILSVIIYQKIISVFLKNILGAGSFCRFTPSCSEYAKRSMDEYGVLKGGYKSILRILHCQPFTN